MPTAIFISAAMAFFAYSTSVFAEMTEPNEQIEFFEMSIEDLMNVEVVTPSRKPQAIDTAPANIIVITERQIKDSGALTLAELLERLPGIYIPTQGHGEESIYIRGVGERYNNKTLLMVDGYPFRDLYYYSHPINATIPLANVKRIEVIRGPGSSLYGTNAFFRLDHTKDLTERLNMRTRAYANMYWSDGEKLSYDSGILEKRKETSRESRIYGLDVQWRYKLFKNNDLLFGATYEYERLDHSWSRKFDPPGSSPSFTGWAAENQESTPTEVSNQNIGLYAEDEIQLIPEVLSLTVGARLDKYEETGSRLSPRAALVWQPWKGTVVKALYGEAFRSPGYRELYKQSDAGENDSSDIGGIPEEMFNIALTYEGLKYVSISSYFRYVGKRNRPSDYQDNEN